MSAQPNVSSLIRWDEFSQKVAKYLALKRFSLKDLEKCIQVIDSQVLRALLPTAYLFAKLGLFQYEWARTLCLKQVFILLKKKKSNSV